MGLLKAKTDRMLLYGLSVLTHTLSATDCCPNGALTAPCCGSSSEAKGSLYTAWPNLCKPCPPTNWGGLVDISFLYWQAQEDGLAFAIKNNPRLTPSSDLYANVDGTYIGLDFDWEPAMKINVGVLFTNAWDFDARWTTYYSKSTHTTASATTNGFTSSGLLPIWVLPQSYQATPSVYGRARGIWQIHLNTLDLELGINPYLTSRLSLRLHGGLKGLSIYQRYRVKYSEGISSGNAQLLESGAVIKNKCDGLGPRIGANSKWFINHGWSFLADLAGSLTLCSFRIKRYDSDRAIATSGTPLYTEDSYFWQSVYVYRPNLEGSVGLAWDRCFGCRDQYTFSFNASYELQYYWKQNLMTQLVSNQLAFLGFSPQGDLHFHGLSATFRFGF